MEDLGLRPLLDHLRKEGASVSWPRARSQAYRWQTEIPIDVTVTDFMPEASLALRVDETTNPDDLVDLISKRLGRDVVEGNA